MFDRAPTEVQAYLPRLREQVLAPLGIGKAVYAAGFFFFFFLTPAIPRSTAPCYWPAGSGYPVLGRRIRRGLYGFAVMVLSAILAAVFQLIFGNIMNGTK